MPSRSISSAKLSAVHLKQNLGLESTPSAATVNILPPTLKHRSSPHCSFSVASGKERQYARNESMFIFLTAITSCLALAGCGEREHGSFRAGRACDLESDGEACARAAAGDGDCGQAQDVEGARVA